MMKNWMAFLHPELSNYTPCKRRRRFNHLPNDIVNMISTLDQLKIIGGGEQPVAGLGPR